MSGLAAPASARSPRSVCDLRHLLLQLGNALVLVGDRVLYGFQLPQYLVQFGFVLLQRKRRGVVVMKKVPDSESYVSLQQMAFANSLRDVAHAARGDEQRAGCLQEVFHTQTTQPRANPCSQGASG